MMKPLCTILVMITLVTSTQAQDVNATKWQGKFEQLDQMLPTPNEYRSSSGSPGPRYWQQQADYDIAAELNDENQSITGSEVITYTNNSPDVLKYLWLQVDQNIFDKNSDTPNVATGILKDSTAVKQLAGQLNAFGQDGGYKIKSVSDVTGKELAFIINKTMMRVNIPQPLKPGQKYSFKVEWAFTILDRNLTSARGGLEYFPEDKNYSYTIAQWFPRMCVYDDVVGWQNKQFLGRGEFALPFGNYKVSLTVPSDHIVAGTGMVTNLKDVISSEQYARFEKAKTSYDAPTIIVTKEEAVAREKGHSKEKKTWKFVADNVRDFAFASSRKYIWDAQAVRIGSKSTLAMSYYPKEGNPLWEKESTKAVKNCLEVYSRLTVDYPYPQATSVHGASIGMEYPMICFNFGRPDKDGKYTDDKLRGMIGVIVHEVGHNFFPMIINNDERQWTWMDEGLNSFVQLLTELERYPNINWERGKPAGLVDYMKGDPTIKRPLMTNSEQIIQFGSEQYAKCAAGLYILRESVMGHQLFDAAFKEYATRWAFKHPKPADFFRTMEDASAVDLDWFWKGWFYTTDYVDQSIDNVKWLKMRNDKQTVENKTIDVKTPEVNDLSKPNYFTVIPTDDRFYGEFANRIDEAAVINKLKDKNFYEINMSNKGGLVMPVIIQWNYRDGSKEIERIPTEIWRTNETKFSKVFVKDKEVASVIIDPLKETTDINANNNTFPPVHTPTKFDEFKDKKEGKK